MNQLAKLSQAVQLLAEAKTLSEVLNVKDLAEAARQYAKALDLGTESLNYATEIKLRAERRLGEMLLQTERSKGGRPSKKTPDTRAVVSEGPAEAPAAGFKASVQELGINERTARRWQTEAKVPERQFTAWVAEQIDSGEEMSPAGFRRFAQQLEGGPTVKEPMKTLVVCPNCDHTFDPKQAEKRKTKPTENERVYATNKVRRVAQLAFQEVRKIDIPSKATEQAALWWDPLRQLCKMARWSPVRVTILIWATDQRMRRDELTVAAPKSLVKVANSVLDDFRNGRQPSTELVEKAEAFVAQHLR